MAKKIQDKKSASLQVTEYAPLVLETSVGHALHDIEDFRKKIALQCQGESVVVRDCGDCAAQALAFATLYDVAEEVAVKTASGKSILCFDHHRRDTVRPLGVETRVWERMQRARNGSISIGDIAMPARETVIDLAKAWKSIDDGSGDDNVKNLNAWIDYLARSVEPALTITIHGTVSTLPMFTALYVIRSLACTIRYEIGPGIYIPLFIQ